MVAVNSDWGHLGGEEPLDSPDNKECDAANGTNLLFNFNNGAKELIPMHLMQGGLLPPLIDSNSVSLAASHFFFCFSAFFSIHKRVERNLLSLPQMVVGRELSLYSSHCDSEE